MGEFHRVGGGAIENLRLKPAERGLRHPGISILKCPRPADAATQIRAAFPQAQKLHNAARVIGSTTEQQIRQAGFHVIPDPTTRLPNHYRIVHPRGLSGFSDENLELLSRAFTNTSGH